MEKLTRIKALEGVYLQWSWHVENPKKRKYEWPGWKENGGYWDGGKDDCMACEYNRTHHGFCGRNCIVPLFASVGGCCRGSGRELLSPYQRWNLFQRNIGVRKEAARQIRDSAKEEIYRLIPDIIFQGGKLMINNFIIEYRSAQSTTDTDWIFYQSYPTEKYCNKRLEKLKAKHSNNFKFRAKPKEETNA